MINPQNFIAIQIADILWTPKTQRQCWLHWNNNYMQQSMTRCKCYMTSLKVEMIFRFISWQGRRGVAGFKSTTFQWASFVMARLIFSPLLIYQGQMRIAIIKVNPIKKHSLFFKTGLVSNTKSRRVLLGRGWRRLLAGECKWWNKHLGKLVQCSDDEIETRQKSIVMTFIRD